MERKIVLSGLGICILIIFSGLHGVRGDAYDLPPGESYWKADEKDHMGQKDKEKLLVMSKELMRDINHRILQTEGLRQEHGQHLLYEIGTMLGQIKEKYKRQVEMYRQMYNKFNDVSSFVTPEDKHFRPLHYTLVLEFVVAKQLEIEHLVEIVLKVPTEELYVYTPPPQKIMMASNIARNLRTRDPRHPQKPGELPAGSSQEAVEKEIIRMADEERLKMRYRAEYMKRHGNNGAKRK